MRKLFTLLFANLLCMMPLGASINVTDNSLEDWNDLPAEYVVEATCPADGAFLGLKSVKVYADASYINILVEPNMDEIIDKDWVPFHVIIDTDNSDATGGYDEFMDANADIYIEGTLYEQGSSVSYAPGVYKWWGEVGGKGWAWRDPSTEHTDEDCFGFIICTGQLQETKSQFVDGKFEIQIMREPLLSDAGWNEDEFGIGFDIQQNWSSVGVLPQVSPTEDNPNGKTNKLKVRINHNDNIVKIATLDGIKYFLDYIAQTASVIGIDGANDNIIIPSPLTKDNVSFSVTNIRDNAFKGCTGIKSISLPNTITNIGEHAFQDCTGLTSIIIPGSVISIGRQTFFRCTGLTSVTISNSVTNIGLLAFYGCNSLTNILLGTAVEVVESNAFSGCNAIQTITCYGQRPPTVNDYAFEYLPNMIIYVPADYLATYKEHDFWGAYDVRPLGAETVSVTELVVEPTTTTVDVVWPSVSGAATYELVIKDQKGNVFCTLIFDEGGILKQIAFSAPSRGNTPMQPQVAGFSFTVTGLKGGAEYDVIITAKDNNGDTLDTQQTSFTTPAKIATDIDQIDSSSLQGGDRGRLILQNGQIFILRDGKIYNALGQEVK